MAIITIKTTPQEQKQVLEAIKHFKNKQVAVSAIAKEARLNQNRVRYILVDLIEHGYVERIPHKNLNAHYIRYSYKVLKDFIIVKE